MNLIDNGIKEIISIERISTDTEMYFKVTFEDYYGHHKTKNVMSIKNIDKLTWRE